MRTQRALISTAWLILGSLLTAGESPSEQIVSKYSSTAREECRRRIKPLAQAALQHPSQNSCIVSGL